MSKFRLFLPIPHPCTCVSKFFPPASKTGIFWSKQEEKGWFIRLIVLFYGKITISYALPAGNLPPFCPLRCHCHCTWPIPAGHPAARRGLGCYIPAAGVPTWWPWADGRCCRRSFWWQCPVVPCAFPGSKHPGLPPCPPGWGHCWSPGRGNRFPES